MTCSIVTLLRANHTCQNQLDYPSLAYKRAELLEDSIETEQLVESCLKVDLLFYFLSQEYYFTRI